MAQYFEIHPDNPQKRLIQQAVQIADSAPAQGGQQASFHARMQ